MKKLLALNYQPLPIAVHYSFFEGVGVRLTVAGAALAAAVAPYMSAFRQRLTEEDYVFRRERKSELTGQIAEAAQEVYRVMMAINATVRTGRHTSTEAVKASGDKIYHRMRQYGYIVKKSYVEQIGSLWALLEDFAAEYAPDVANLGLAPWVQQLQTAVDTFVDLRNRRLDEQLRKPGYTAAQARKRLQEVWLPIKMVINAHAITSAAAAEFVAFIDRQNVEIEYYRTVYHCTRKSLSDLRHIFIESILTQSYTGEPVMPMPTVYFRDSETQPFRKLVPGRDYAVTYKNNVKVGMGTAVIRGKGAYKGRTTTTFTIAKAGEE
jgi:hypothetical protein